MLVAVWLLAPCHHICCVAAVVQHDCDENLAKHAENIEFGDDGAFTGSLGNDNSDGNGLGDADVNGDDLDTHHGDHLAPQHASCRHQNAGSTSTFRDTHQFRKIFQKSIFSDRKRL